MRRVIASCVHDACVFNKFTTLAVDTPFLGGWDLPWAGRTGRRRRTALKVGRACLAGNGGVECLALLAGMVPYAHTVACPPRLFLFLRRVGLGADGAGDGA